MATGHAIYRGKNPIDVPAYGIAEAAGYLRLPAVTVRSWVLGREYPTKSGQRHFQPVVPAADPAHHLLSFHDLIELHVLAAIRRQHGVRLQAVRKMELLAKDYRRQPHEIEEAIQYESQAA